MEYKKSGMKIFALFIVVIMVVSISACAVSGTTEDQTSNSQETEEVMEETEEAAEPVKVGMIASGFGTQSYNDDVLDGVSISSVTNWDLKKFTLKFQKLQMLKIVSVR